MKLSWFVVILLLAVVALFSVQNADAITIRFLGWNTRMSAALVIQLAAFCGALAGLIVGGWSRRRAPAPGAAANSASPGQARGLPRL